MKRKVSMVLSAMLIASVFVTSVPASTDEVQIATRSFDKVVTVDSKMQIEYGKESNIKYVQNVPVEFERPVNAKEVVVLLDSSSEVSEIVKHKSPFDYALFSGDPKIDMDLKGAGLTIKGDIHSESSVSVSSSNFELDGECEAVKKVEIETGSAKYDKDKIKEGVESVAMEDYTIFFDDKARTIGTYFSFEIDGPTGRPFCERTLKDPMGTKGFVNWNIIDERLIYGATLPLNEYYTGLTCQYEEKFDKWTLSGSEKLKLSKDNPLFFDGNVLINCGSGVVGEGFIVATGDITFNTGEVTAKGDDTGIDKDKKTIAGVGLYSIGGDIEFAVGGSEFTGLLYAPNGTVNLQTKEMNIKGSVVAKEVITKINGLNITYTNTSAHDDLTEFEVKNTHLITARDAIGSFVSSLKGKGDRVGILTYQNDANDNVFELFDVEKDKDSINKAIGKIVASDKNDNNLGDGLRRAYHLLKDKGVKNSDKYIIVLSCANPDKWTISGAGETEPYMTASGDAIKVPSGSDISKGADYAKEILKNINSDTTAKIKTHFVDFRFGKELDKIKEIASGTSYYDPKSDNEEDFDEALATTMSSISTEILKEVNYLSASEVKFTAEFEDLFPVGVKYVEPTPVPTSTSSVPAEPTPTPLFNKYTDNKGTSDDTTDDRNGIKKLYDSDAIEVKEVADKFLVKIKDEEFIPSRVKFSAFGGKLFDGGKIKFEVSNVDGTETTKISETKKSGYIEKLQVEVIMKVDLN